MVGGSILKRGIKQATLGCMIGVPFYRRNIALDE
jgi:hypothetical protein